MLKIWQLSNAKDNLTRTLTIEIINWYQKRVTNFFILNLEEVIKVLAKEHNFDAKIQDLIRETLYCPHIHQYQGEYASMIDHGKKTKFKLTKPKINLEEISDETSKILL